MDEKPTVLIVGATGSIGEAIVREYAKNGYFVLIHYHSHRTKAEELLEAVGGSGELIVFDISDKESIRSALEGVEVDVLVNSAGIIRDSLLFFMEDEKWEEVIDTNLNALFYIIRAVSRSMIRNKKGSIVNVASISGIIGNPGQANYAASKGGVIALTKTLAAELGRYGIRVNALAPGIIESEMISELPDTQALKKAIPLGRFGKPEEVAKCAWFIGHEASYVSGEVLNISGAMVR